MEVNDIKIKDLYPIAEKIVTKHKIYGVECLFRAAINAAIKEPYIDEESLHDLVRGAYRLFRKEAEDGKD
jgi:hypothetical protein